jgi:peptide deformylase
MAVRPIVLYASAPEMLRRRSDPVGKGLADVRGLAADLVDTLRDHGDGVGLAAPQIGVHKRVIVVCLGASAEGRKGSPQAVIDPVIVEAARELPDFDGCLSFPGFFGETIRPHSIRLRGMDQRGRGLLWTLEGFDAVVVHHEVDHLEGVLFVDRLESKDKLYTEAQMRAHARLAKPH